MKAKKLRGTAVGLKLPLGLLLHADPPVWDSQKPDVSQDTVEERQSYPPASGNGLSGLHMTVSKCVSVGRASPVHRQENVVEPGIVLTETAVILSEPFFDNQRSMGSAAAAGWAAGGTMGVRDGPATIVGTGAARLVVSCGVGVAGFLVGATVRVGITVGSFDPVCVIARLAAPAMALAFVTAAVELAAAAGARVATCTPLPVLCRRVAVGGGFCKAGGETAEDMAIALA